MSWFNNESKTDFRNSDTTTFGHENCCRTIKMGDYVILSNKDTKTIFAVARVAGPCYKPNPGTARNIYREPKYNKWEMPIENIVFLRNPVSLDYLRKWIGGENAYRTNIYKPFRNGFQQAFINSRNISETEKAEILHHLDTFVRMFI